MSFLDNFRLFASGAVNGPYGNYNGDKADIYGGKVKNSVDRLGRDEAKSKLVQEVKTWQNEHPENVKGTIFDGASDEDMANFFDEYARNKTKDYLGDDYSATSAEDIDKEEVTSLNNLLYSIKSDDFFREGKDFKDEVDTVRERISPGSYKGNIPANNQAREHVMKLIKNGSYRTRQAAFNGVSDYIGNLRKASAEATPTEEYITLNFAPGDNLGQKIIDAGLATDNGLWGANGDVAYYANQMQLANPDVINAGSSFKVLRRK